MVEAATHVVPGARWAGVSMIEGRKVVAKVPTDPVVAKLDDVQSELGDGPCITALRDHRTVHVPDLTKETRWPQYCSTAVQLGMRSLLSFQLFVRSENLGALNLSAGQADVFSEDSIEVGTILAQHAAVALVGSTGEGHLQSALATRDLIGQAKGILMHRSGLTGVQAFSLLTRTSQETNMKLVDVARWLVSEHEEGLH